MIALVNFVPNAAADDELIVQIVHLIQQLVSWWLCIRQTNWTLTLTLKKIIVVPLHDGYVDNNHSNGGNGGDCNGKDLEGLHLMGWWLHQFDELKKLFDNFMAELEWGNKDYVHNLVVKEDGEYAPEG